MSTQVVHESNIGPLTYDDDIRDCTIDEVCAVRVGDRVLVLPIDRELAAGSGFEVINIDAKYLTSIGVKPRVAGSSVSPPLPTAALTPPSLDYGDPPEDSWGDSSVVVDPVAAQSGVQFAVQSSLPTLPPVALPQVDASPMAVSSSNDTSPIGSEPAVRPVDQGVVEGWFGVTNLTSDPNGSGPAATNPANAAAAELAAPSHPLHHEDGSLIGTLETQAVIAPGTDRRSNAPWATVTQDTFVSAPSTPAAEALAGTATSAPTTEAAPVHSPIAAQLVDWSVLDAVVEPARPLDVTSANREDGSGLAPVGWPEIDRRAPELLDTAPAAFNPFAKPTPTTTRSNRVGDQAVSHDLGSAGAAVRPSVGAAGGPSVVHDATVPAEAPTAAPVEARSGSVSNTPSPSVSNVPSPSASNVPSPSASNVPSPSASSVASNSPSVSNVPSPAVSNLASDALSPSESNLAPSATESNLAQSATESAESPTAGHGRAGLGTSPGASLRAAPKIASAVFASVVASQIVLRDSTTPANGYLGISFVLAPGEAMEVRGTDAAQVLQLFRTLAGFVAPESGSLDVDGEDRSALAPTERARREALFSGALFDAPVLIPERSVAANLEIPLRAAGIAAATAVAMTASRIETMGLTVLGPHRVDALSADLRVLVGAARSLITPSPLVVIAMDTRPLADETVKWLHALVDQARRGGAAIVYRSSDPRFGFDNSRIAMLSNGVLAPVAGAE